MTTFIQTTGDRTSKGMASTVAVRIAAIIAVVTAVVLDFLVQTLWLPTLASRVAVNQLRPDDAAAESMRAITTWSHWSHVAVCLVIGAALLALLASIGVWPGASRAAKGQSHE